jgi:hypothetical protein
MPKQWFDTLDMARDIINSTIPHHWVYLAPSSRIPDDLPCQLLRDFEHPEKDTIYVLGDDDFGFEIEPLLPFDDTESVVCIDGPMGDAQALWTTHVSSIVLYDRWDKSFR